MAGSPNNGDGTTTETLDLAAADHHHYTDQQLRALADALEALEAAVGDLSHRIGEIGEHLPTLPGTQAPADRIAQLAAGLVDTIAAIRSAAHTLTVGLATEGRLTAADAHVLGETSLGLWLAAMELAPVRERLERTCRAASVTAAVWRLTHCLHLAGEHARLVVAAALPYVALGREPDNA